jgi:hypothetical protein
MVVAELEYGGILHGIATGRKLYDIFWESGVPNDRKRDLHMTDDYRLWFVRRDKNVQGPFPEPLVCRFLAIGRLVDTDEVSQDGTYWRQVEDVPVLTQGVQALLEPTGVGEEADEAWVEDRGKAALRWLDERKSPDPRGRQAPPQFDAAIMERRSGRDRRKMSETVELKAYREGRGDFESWLRNRRQRYGPAAGFVALLLLLLTLIALLLKPVNPIAVGLQISNSDCAAAARKGVNWSGCDKDGALLVGADLRSAELVGTSLKQANLSFADLSRANLLQAELRGANLSGARLGNAVWVDGRVCAEGSVGLCK